MKPTFLFLCWCFAATVNAQTTTLSYPASAADFANPERGFYRYTETRASDYTPLEVPTLQAFRALHTPSGASYSIYSTLIFRYFVLDAFVDAPISASFLTSMQADFVAARQAGVKLIVRFAYTVDVANTNCSDGICPPYGDASPSRVLGHIAQLAPVLQANYDVIATVQLGFIGIWGENYYTDYFGDASPNGQGYISTANWQQRNEVLEALLDAVPASRMVQVRYPQLKQKYVYGAAAAVTSAALSAGQAYNGTAIARIGHHNDCLLASADDFGTYASYDDPPTTDTTNLRAYKTTDSRFVAVGGETCFDYNPFNNCQGTNASAYGDTELKRFHYSYLNADYNNMVNNDWVIGGCMDAIKRQLGYRFELQSGEYSNEAAPGQSVTVNLSLRNTGYAAPFNARAAEIVLRNQSSGQRWFAALSGADPRFWLPQTMPHEIASDLCLPLALPAGQYEVLFNLPDPTLTLYARPEYSIRLASQLPNASEVWETATGYNKLGHTLTVQNNAANPACLTGQPVFSLVSGVLPIELTAFTAEPEGQSIRLRWTTAYEADNLGFNLQRSTDGQGFQTIAWMPGQGTSTAPHHYSQLDSNLTPGQLYYYRLEQLDLDSTAHYSPIITALAPSSNQTASAWIEHLTVFPQPASGNITVRCTASVPGGGTIAVSDVLGRSVATLPFNAGEQRFDCSYWGKGVFVLRFERNGVRVVRRVVLR